MFEQFGIVGISGMALVIAVLFTVVILIERKNGRLKKEYELLLIWIDKTAETFVKDLAKCEGEKRELLERLVFYESANVKIVYVVGKYRADTIKGALWDIQGVFTSKTGAIKACRDRKDLFYGEIELNKEYPYETELWNVIYPERMLINK